MDRAPSPALPPPCAGAATSPFCRVAAVAVWTYLVALAFALNFSNDALFDKDPYYHARYASTLPGALLERTFPATAYSVWADRFGDKEFLFHLALAPFCQVEAWILPGAKLAAVLFLVGFLVSLRHAMARQGIRGATFWVAAMVATSPQWWGRMTMVRGQLGAMLLFPWIIHLFERRRARSLAVVCFLFAWTYTAPYFALILVFLMMVGRTVARLLDESHAAPPGATPDARLFAASAIGTLAGMLLHPHTPNHLYIQWIHLAHVLPQAWGVATKDYLVMGEEFASQTFRLGLTIHTGTAIMLAVAWVLAAFGPRAPGSRSALLLWMTLPLAALYALSFRFIEYLAPISLWALASIVEDQRAGRSWGDVLPTARARLAAATALAAAVLGLHVYGMSILWPALRDPDWGRDQKAAAAWLGERCAPGDLIVPFDWRQFPQLYFHAPQLRYLVGLDPILMDVAHPEEMQLLAEMAMGVRRYDAAALAAAFPGARFAVAWWRTPEVAETLAAQGVEPVYADGDVSIYALPPSAAAEGAP